MTLRSVMRRVAGGGMLAASLLMAMPTSALACTQVYIGKNQTTTGDTYVGRSEDYSSRYAKCFGVQERQENPRFVSYENGAGNGFDWTYEGTGYRYTYVRDLPSAWGAQGDADASKVYSEAGTNECGVSVSATLTTSMNGDIRKVDPGVDTGIGEYNLADVILATASTARDGVEKLGAIIDEQGSYDCNQIIIADADETWIFMQLSGHQWLAREMGDDEVSVNPNMGKLQFKVDLDDTSRCLHSAGVVSVPQEAGLLKTYDDGTPNIAATYGEVNSGEGQYTRLAQGRAYFGVALTEGEDYTVNAQGQVNSIADPQLTFTPGFKLGTFEAVRSLAARGEQVDSLNANLNPSLYAIGNNCNVDNHIFQIREGLSADIATVQWEALSRAEFGLFLPSYSALLTEVPQDYYPLWTTVSSEHEGRKDSVETALTEEPGKNLDYVMMDINTLAYNNRDAMAANTRAYLDVLQKQIIAQQDVVDAVMQATPEAERTELANRAFATVTEQAYGKVKALLNEMRAYLNAGTEGAFCPSDYDAVTGEVAEPIAYASSLATLAFTCQPASATYEQGAAAAPLTAAATVQGAVEGFDAQVSYQWYTVDASGAQTAIEGATDASYTPATDELGAVSYQVRAVTATGLEAWSQVATVTVEAKKVVPDAQEGNAGQVSEQAAKKVARALPKTGDDTLAIVAGVAVVGVIAAGAGIALSRKRK